MVDISNIALKLLNLTLKRKVGWSVAGSDSYAANLGEASVVISDKSGGLREIIPDYRLSVFDLQGRLIESSSSPLDVLSKLYEAARKEALDVDGVLSKLNRKLDAL